MSYEKPELQILGSIEELTQGSTQDAPDVDVAGNIAVGSVA